jgi:hypothetical protein
VLVGEEETVAKQILMVKALFHCHYSHHCAQHLHKGVNEKVDCTLSSLPPSQNPPCEEEMVMQTPSLLLLGQELVGQEEGGG